MPSIRRLLREPLLHFVVLGLLLFVLFYATGGASRDDDDQIVVSAANIRHLSAGWEKRWGRPPSDEERAGLIRDYVREEILNREAIALGLDRGDTIIRRRLAQKMEFLFADLAGGETPSEEQLDAYWQDHNARFTEPERVAFKHVYLSQDRRGGELPEDAARLLSQLKSGEAGDDYATLGDSFMFPKTYRNRSEREVARIFGSAFATQLFSLEPGAWRGPVASGYGVHLVFIDRKIPARPKPLSEVRERVVSEWQRARRRDAEERFFTELEKRYRVEIESSPELEGAGIQQ